MLSGMAKRSRKRSGERSRLEKEDLLEDSKSNVQGKKNETNGLSDKLDHIESFISSDGKSFVIGKTGQTRQLLTLRENTVLPEEKENTA